MSMTLKEVAEYFIETAEAAVANQRRPKGGQQVSYHGDFASIPPSAVKNLEWWANRFRDALNQPKCQCQWEAGDSPCRVHGEESL
jgi:hypothetical protein